MKLLISHKLDKWREPVEEETRRRVEKMEKLLKRYALTWCNCTLYRETAAKR